MAQNDKSDSEQEQQKQERAFRQEQYEILLRCSAKKDITEWNRWYEEHLKEEILLQGANLVHASLEGADLGIANLKGAKLERANLKGANLEFANLKGANLGFANLQGANLRAANLEGADLVHANLEGAKLRFTNLQDVKLYETNLERADLDNCQDIVFDSTYILNTRHIPKNPWHRLRNKYTGIKLAFHLILLVTFVLIYSAKAMFWYGMHKGQTVIINELASLESFVEEELTLQDPNELATQESQAQQNIAIAISKICSELQKKVIGKYQDAKGAVGERFQSLKVWQILLSQDKGIWFQFTTIVLIIYNVLRYVLTRCVAPLSAEEDRSHYTPRFRAAAEADSKERILHFFSYYRNLLWFHWVNSFLWFVAVASFAIHCYDWMTADVLILK